MKMICIECPNGCELEVSGVGENISVSGYACPRGKIYAQTEVVCPRRVLTTTVKTHGGKVVAVKTDAPIKKSEIFEVMKKINNIKVDLPVEIGQVLYQGITEKINLIATAHCK